MLRLNWDWLCIVSVWNKKESGDVQWKSIKYVKSLIYKILLVILAIFLCVAFYELLGICVAYKKQPEVSNTTKKETKNGSWNEWSENTELAVIIEKNPEALLQRVRLIKNAKKEIILSTFAFQSDESGKLILGALHDAADRGVHIRLLVDGMKS